MWPFKKPFGANLTQEDYSFLHNIFLKFFGHPFIWSKGELVLHYLHPKPGDRILDIGSGAGVFASEYAARGARVTGIDIELGGIGGFVPAVARFRERILFVTADAAALPFRESSFNKVTILDCLEHIKDDEQVIDQIRRVLVPNGVVLITVPTYPGYPPHRVFTRTIRLLPKSLLRKVERTARNRVLAYANGEDSVVVARADTEQILKAFGHVRHYTPDGITTLLQKQRFKVLSARQFQKLFESEMLCFHFGVRGFDHPFLYPIMRAIASLDCLLPKSYPGVELLIVAKKTL